MNNNNETNPWVVSFESPEGDIFKGRGLSLEDAIKDATKQWIDYNTPKKGPGIWEPQKLKK